MVVFADGILLFQNQTVEVEEPNNDADVDTIPGGRTGVAPGPDVTNVSVTNAVPKAGAEYDWEKRKRERATVELMVQQIGSSKKMKGTFLVRSFSQSSSAGAPVLQNITLSSLGSPAPIFE
jgi:hypothetical protein